MLVFLLCCVGIWGRWFFRHSPGAALSDPGSRTKYRSVDVFRYQPVFLRLGLICSLAFTLLAFNWTQSEARTLSDQVSLAEWEEIDQVPPITNHPAPSPPPPPPPKFEAVSDPGIIDTITFGSMDVGSKTLLPPRMGKPPVPPPPPPPPPVKYTGPDYFTFAEEMPVFGDCTGEADKTLRKQCSDRAIIEFIGKHVRYPAIARENGISGIAVIRFIVEKDGSLTDISIVREPGAGLGTEAARVVALMGQSELSWQAGKQQGRPVRVQFNLPVRFTLQ
jgi:protein TonB